ncbi:MAG: hypothetical protein M3303_06485, partial [Gemmatimonadota bacterium]|nr:hypothetical protein [Gemmatimonadota bacterium]
FRAICGGGRYDDLLKNLGGVDLPALGFGMGDVVLGALLEARGLAAASVSRPDFWVAAEADDALDDVMSVATALRRVGASVEYALRPQALGKQRKAAFSSGASYFVLLATDFRQSRRLDVQPLVVGEEPGAARLPALEGITASRTVDTLADLIGRNWQAHGSIDQAHAHDG